jgi:hypothetical protein
MLRNWSAEEDALLRSAGTRLAEVAQLLPGRTHDAIKNRRKALGITQPASPRWTTSDDKKLKKYAREPLAKLVKIFKSKSRTRCAIRYRRKFLGHLYDFRKLSPWLGSEIKQLKLMYPTASREELLASFPRHTTGSIDRAAHGIGLHRVIYRPIAPQDCLREQIRQRAKEDGIALGKLGAQTNIGAYLQYKRPKREDYNKIARVVEFFGGRLTIDWQDV